MGILDIDALFDQSIAEPLDQARKQADINLVVGVPFFNEKFTLPKVLQVIEQGLADAKQLDRTLIVCAGDHRGSETLEIIAGLPFKAAHLEFLMLPGANGRGYSIRAILEIANLMEADVLLFTSDLTPEENNGLQPEWVQRILEPIRMEYDFVVTTLKKNYFEDYLNSLLVAPLLEAFYGYQINSALSGIYAIANNVVGDLCTEIKFWEELTRDYGIDPWLITRAIRWNKKICQVELGAKLEGIYLEKLNYMFKVLAKSMFECIKRDEDFWLSGRYIRKSPDIYWSGDKNAASEPSYSAYGITNLFRRGLNQYKTLYKKILPDLLYADIERIVAATAREPRFNSKIWAHIVYWFLFHYCFATDANSDDVLDALACAFFGRLTTILEQAQTLKDDLKNVPHVNAQNLIAGEIAAAKEDQLDSFLKLREDFFQVWEQKAQELKPSIIPEHYLEFIPGIPIALPKELEGRGGRVVWSEGMFNRLQSKYQEAFHNFIHNSLGVPENADSRALAKRLREFMDELCQMMDRLLPGDPFTVEGTQQVVDALFQLLPSRMMFYIKDELLRKAFLLYPPLNLMIPAGCHTSRVLLERMDVRKAITLANLIENRKWADGILLWILDNVKPEDFGEVEIEPIVLGPQVLGGGVQLGAISDLNKLTTRIVIRPLSKDMGGDYPKLRFTLFVARHIMIARNYSALLRTYARERKNLGLKIRNSLLGRYETTAFSVHNIFEDFHHRALVSQFRNTAGHLAETGQAEDARLLEMMCEGYGLSQVLADGTFIPCSAWSWASFSYKGGRGIPTPLSSHVEEKWFNHDFLEEIYTELGYDPSEIMHTVTHLIGEGRASDNLLDALLGIRRKDVTVVVQETQDYPPAKPLERYSGNPILCPIKEHAWESKYVLNAAAVRIGDLVYLLYRAFGDDETSRIGLAITDGYHVLERMPEPIFGPHDEKDKKGVEDPRVVIVEDQIYMLYTAYDGAIAQISAASITVENFLKRDWDRWERKGFAFQDIWDKDAILFPERIDGRYVIYHRIEPSIWVSHLDRLEFPAPKEKHSIIMGPRSGRMWDSVKIGAGTQPIKTRFGWLLIYHGVDRDRVYRLGVILTDLKNPERLLYRSPNPVLSPETEYEIGNEDCWVPRVVFTCGAVPVNNKAVLDAEDEILVYYGAADTYVCLATAKVGDLIPEAIRQNLPERSS
ncbi:MAG: glycosidase [Thermacetogeniaceae bacterium]